MSFLIKFFEFAKTGAYDIITMSVLIGLLIYMIIKYVKGDDDLW